MRVLIVGEDAAGGVSDSFARGFEEGGAEVIRYCPVRRLALANPASATRLGRWALRPLAVRRLNRAVVQELGSLRVDLALAIKAQHLSADTVRGLRQKLGAPFVNFYPDDPFSTVRSNRLTFGPEALAAYDACYTFARHLMPSYRRVGVERVHYLPFARDPGLHAPLDEPVEPEYDVVFVGNIDAERERWLEVVARSYRLAVFGVDTRQQVSPRSALARAAFFPAAYGIELARALARGRVSINVMRVQNAGSHNMRSFESPACGSFTLSQRTPELVQLFQEGKEVACFGSPAELTEQLDYWLARADQRAEVAAAGFRRVQNDTYRMRAEEILATALA